MNPEDMTVEQLVEYSLAATLRIEAYENEMGKRARAAGYKKLGDFLTDYWNERGYTKARNSNSKMSRH